MIIEAKRTYNFWFEQPAISLFLFVTVILLIRLFLRGAVLELDEAEQVIIAQRFVAGYPNQPPLYTWLQYGFFQLFGLHLLSLALLKSMLLFASLYCFHQICRLHCQTILLAWCATLAWAFIPAISYDLIKDNTHSVLALFAVTLTWYWFIAPSNLTKTTWHLIFGCVISIGVLSKFNYLLFLAILFISALSLNDYRVKLLNSGLLLTLLIVLALTSPYFVWLAQHYEMGLRSTYKMVPSDKQQWQGLIELIKASLFFSAPCWAILIIFFPLNRWSMRKTALNSLLMRYHLISLPLLAMMILVAGISNFETRWLIPIFFLSPVLYFSQVNTKLEVVIRAKIFLLLCLLLQIMLFLVLIHRSHNKDKGFNQFPLVQMTQIIKNQLKDVDQLVSDSHWLLGNLMMDLSFNRGWLVYPDANISLPKGHLLLIWQSAKTPFWLKSYSLSQLKMFEDPKNHRVIAGQAYLLTK